LCIVENSIRSDGNDSLETVWCLGVSFDDLNWESGDWVDVFALLSVYVHEWVLGVFFVSDIEKRVGGWSLSVALDDLNWESGDWINILAFLGVHVHEWVLSIVLISNIELDELMCLWLFSVSIDDFNWESGDWVDIFVVLSVHMWEGLLGILVIGNVRKLDHSVSLDHILTIEVEDLLLLGEGSWGLTWGGGGLWHDWLNLWLSLLAVFLVILDVEFEWTSMSIIILTFLSNCLESLESGELLITFAHVLGALHELGVLPDWGLVT